MPPKTQSADEYMDTLDHPYKAEVQALRDIIKAVHPGIVEQVKWNAPSYRYKDYICTFNLRAQQHVHLIFHNPNIASIDNPILEGDYPDRRMVYFAGIDDVKAKQAAVEYVVRELVRLMDE